MTGKFVISLDFELFWGVGDTQTIGGYGRNVLGEWQAVPRMLALFRYHHLNVTWATVGAIMCRDYRQWRALRPMVRPGAAQPTAYACAEDELVRQNPKLFFARPLVERILDTDGQELATHTYSHFYCNDADATPEKLADDLQCAREVAAAMGAGFQTVVFPRNQIGADFLKVLPAAGIRVYRGNAQHWLFRDGDAVRGGLAGRIVRRADAYLPLSGSGRRQVQIDGDLVNVPASMFLYPWSALSQPLMALRLRRIMQGMTDAARTGALFHLWWHPHNFGVNLGQNMAMLGEILRHYRYLADAYGMQSQSMGAFAATAGAQPAARPQCDAAGAARQPALVQGRAQ
jgi:peptidoglycan/xylan/chitin deacetylase (PgdA/CDA1 family)